VQVLLAVVLVDAAHPALEDRELALGQVIAVLHCAFVRLFSSAEDRSTSSSAVWTGSPFTVTLSGSPPVSVSESVALGPTTVALIAKW
jgi:hypothetical protein